MIAVLLPCDDQDDIITSVNICSHLLQFFVRRKTEKAFLLPSIIDMHDMVLYALCNGTARAVEFKRRKTPFLTAAVQKL